MKLLALGFLLSVPTLTPLVKFDEPSRSQPEVEVQEKVLEFHANWKNSVHEDGLVADVIKITAGSGGRAQLKNVRAGKIITRAGGGSSIQISGVVGTHEIRVSGGSTLRALELESERTELRLSGGSGAYVYATDTLDLNVSGASTVRVLESAAKINEHVDRWSRLIRIPNPKLGLDEETRKRLGRIQAQLETASVDALKEQLPHRTAAVTALERHMGSESQPFRLRVIEALGHGLAWRKEAVEPLAKVLADRHDPHREAALKALRRGLAWRREAVAPLVAVAEDADDPLREHAFEALRYGLSWRPEIAHRLAQWLQADAHAAPAATVN